jgi:hypothetical protein
MPDRVITNDDFELMIEAFLHFYHLDHSNAPVHMAEVRYSPITFQLGRMLDNLGATGDELANVRRHDGAYEWDLGR